MTSSSQSHPAMPVRAVPAARALARERGIALEGISGSGPEGIILSKDIPSSIPAAAPAAQPQAGAAAGGPASGVAMRLAQKLGVDLSTVTGSGPRGRITKADVEEAARHPQARAAASPDGGPAIAEVQKASGMRKTIAKRLSHSAITAPHVYFWAEICMDPVLKLHGAVKESILAKYEAKLSVNDWLIKAVALTLREFPQVNASFDGEQITYWGDINVGLAVALEQGLIVPAIAQADQAPMWEIAAQRIDLVSRARSRKLEGAEVNRGTFTLSSLAYSQVTQFTSIINPPQSAILSVGKTRRTPVFDERDRVVAANLASMCLGVDHRIVDGAVAADFLGSLQTKLENPALLFMEI